MCNASWDGLTCWPPTPTGRVVRMSCFSELRGIPYDTSENATKFCHLNGTWAKKADYSHCRPVNKNSSVDDSSRHWEQHLENAKLLQDIGHAISLVCLVFAFAMFAYLKSIRCTRNNIHWNLVATFILRNTSWFIIQAVVTVEAVRDKSWYCRAVVTLNNYFSSTNFFWMFVEGLYLHIMVAHAFNTEKFDLWVYAMVGWCVPVPIIVAWVLVKVLAQDEGCWISSSYYDFIFHGPIILILLVNFIILGNVVRILVLKLRASPEHREATHYSIKAAKATVVLLPLLGVTYVLFIVHPSGQGTSRLVFIYFNSFFQSFQGSFVSIIYCFTNAEIRNAVKRRIHLSRCRQQDFV
ncbi:PREDICTED: corticotropin-releasing factor receptor 2-like [Branchiostoma belcheri]|uniref:Corticotropin-releasing factor receptor 2-like n=1 Tax=Branchiostoma belcheri TaxID=7741 RepID=A0A6P4Z1G1_BRABE|nr:PREDICTED: corticotropin-releasing factor receptor 2-like [Branchiostoma belcheri]